MKFGKLFLSAVLCLAMLPFAAGCGTVGELEEEFYDDGEPYNLVYYMYYNSANPPQDMDAVNAQVNRLLQSKLPNTTIDIIPYIASEYTTKVTAAIVAGTPFDICFTSPEINPYLVNVQREAFLPVEWMINEYAPVTKASLREEMVAQTRYNGKSYAVLNEQIYPRTYAVNFKSKALIKKYLDDNYGGITTDEIYTILNAELTAFDFIRNYLTWLNVNDYGHGGTIHQIDTASTLQNYFLFDDLGTGMGTPGVVKLNEIGEENGKYSATVVNQFESAEYETMLNFVYELKDKGFLNPNLGESNYDIVAENNWKPGYLTGQIGRLGSPAYFTTYIMGSMNAISSTSQNPARAMKFLELLRTDVELHNTIQYGIEGEHYILDSENENRISEFIGTGFNNAQFGWGLGTEFISYLQPNQPDDLWEQVKDINSETEMSPLIGFQFDPTPVKQKIADCRSVSAEFMVALQQGQYADKAASLAEFRQRLKEAGCDAVIAEKQRQLNEFFANK